MKRPIEDYFAFGSIIMALASLVALIIFLLFFTSCTFIDEPKYTVDPKLSAIVDQFFIEAKNRGCDCKPQSLIVEVYPLEDGVNGRSFTIPGVNTIPHIAIDQDFYNTIYHELGHAIFNLEHTNNGGLMDYNGGEWHYSTESERKVFLDKLIQSGCNLYK